MVNRLPETSAQNFLFIVVEIGIRICGSQPGKKNIHYIYANSKSNPRSLEINWTKVIPKIETFILLYCAIHFDLFSDEYNEWKLSSWLENEFLEKKNFHRKYSSSWPKLKKKRYLQTINDQWFCWYIDKKKWTSLKVDNSN